MENCHLASDLLTFCNEIEMIETSLYLNGFVDILLKSLFVSLMKHGHFGYLLTSLVYAEWKLHTHCYNVLYSDMSRHGCPDSSTCTYTQRIAPPFP